MGAPSNPQSTTKTDSSTKVTTNTTTNVGDIGFTGADFSRSVEFLEAGFVGIANATTGLQNINLEANRQNFETIKHITDVASDIQPVVVEAAKIDPKLILAAGGIAVALAFFVRK